MSSYKKYEEKKYVLTESSESSYYIEKKSTRFDFLKCSDRICNEAIDRIELKIKEYEKMLKSITSSYPESFTNNKLETDYDELIETLNDKIKTLNNLIDNARGQIRKG